MPSAPHVICRQQLGLRLGCPPAAAQALQRRVEHTLLGPPLLAALDEALTQALAAAHLPADTWLTLDHLALDLGNLPADDLEAQLQARLPEQLREQVAAAARRLVSAGASAAGGRLRAPVATPSAAHPGSAGASSAGAARPGTSMERSQSVGPASLARHLPGKSGPAPAYQPATWPEQIPPETAGLAPGLADAAPTAWAAWLFFLRQGTLPAYWPAPGSLAAWEKELRSLLRTAPAAWRAQLRQLLPTVAQRLVRQFSPTLIAAVLAAVAPIAKPPIGKLKQVLTRLLRPASYSGAEPGVSAASSIAATVAGSMTSSTVGETWVLTLLGQLGAEALPDWEALLSTLQALASAGPSLSEQAGGALVAAGFSGPGSPVAGSAAQPPAKASFLAEAAGQAAAPAGAHATSADSRPAQSVAALVQTSPSQPLRPGLAAAVRATDLPAEAVVDYVQHAGVVLLHPFLPACFDACGWLADGQFVSPAAQAQAVLLVHFLATGRGQAAEYELRLPRLLCGVPGPAPAPTRRLKLAPAARAEGRALLRAALAHWGALRNTTPAGLRTAFLQREGKLEPTASPGPTLTVEQRAQDVLLSRLPYGWSLSLVRLPWLKQPLLVNWS